ncbi:CLUMA_CG001961, isoform A [Clunio marinus]|uniref:Complex I assembly factor TIMMDC1, mitochondrial n=1 Tax=Clunio marinus TaxID=568069 RepID=A0A1J1HJE7_9DIPT|nr:CLUMA_CG001961, isoform A [Clunio marinus]
MIKKLWKVPISFAFGPTITPKSVDVPSKKYYDPKLDYEETGWERISRMFTVDEFGRMSNECNSILQAGFFGMFVGGVYGGFLGSRKAYFDFLDNNQATAFKSHLDAKRKLQDKVTLGFAQNAFRFSWRLALFTTSYTAITTIISSYRGKSSMYEYVIAGAVTGAGYKMNMGLKGMAAGILVGGGLGALGGAASLLILKSSGMTMEEIRYYQYKWRSGRDDDIGKSFQKQSVGTDRHNPDFDVHDSQPHVGSGKLDLKIYIPDEDDNIKPIEKSVSEKK